MKSILFLSAVLLIVSCSKNSEVSKKLSGCDSLVVNFFETQSTTVSKTVATGDKKAVQRLAEFVSAKETEPFKCGYDGELLFFEKGKPVSNVSFKFSDAACMHFLLDVKGKLVSTKMSNDAKDFLESLSQGKNTY